jgi:hypothetical protein
MRSEEEKKRIRQMANDALKKDFIKDNKPVKQDPPKKKFGTGGFGR